MDDVNRPPLDAKVEALLFSSEVPLPSRRLADLTGEAKGRVLEAIDRLNVHYAETERAFRITEIAGGYQMTTVPEHADVLAGLHKERVPTRLSRAALETLAVIAFKQPVTRAEVDRIRGVTGSDGVLRHLIERSVVRIAGRAEAPGRPLLYGTTREFLSYFGLAALSDLPRTDELKAMLAGDVAAAPEDGDGDEAPPAPDAGPSAGEAAAAPDGGPGTGAEPDDPAAEAESHSGEEPDDIAAETESHSGEESGDREGVPAS